MGLQAGSSVAVAFETAGSGAWRFEVTGKPPTPVTATGKAGSTATVQCPAGARILIVPRVSYGADGCSSGGAQYVVETRCLLQRECEVAVDDTILGPT